MPPQAVTLRSPRRRILIAEDERRIASLIEQGLLADGFATTVVTDGDNAQSQAATGQYDLLLLDLGLPGKDGFAVLRQLRESDCRIPVVILTARGGVEDTVAGLEGGADDYLSKPFRFAELLARVRRRLRDDGDTDQHVLRCCGFALDLHARTIHLDERVVELTEREFRLAETFLRNCGRVLSREQLLAAVWGHAEEPGSNVVDVYVRYLRRKLGPHSITTVRGKGYRLADDRC
jgi:two-component system copper resistance phosphate regulon response regulator CusR